MHKNTGFLLAMSILLAAVAVFTTLFLLDTNIPSSCTSIAWIVLITAITLNHSKTAYGDIKNLYRDYAVSFSGGFIPTVIIFYGLWYLLQPNDLTSQWRALIFANLWVGFSAVSFGLFKIRQEIKKMPVKKK